MKALTVQQPWAWAIMSGAKTIENRTAYWTHRGPLAIHAGARLSERGADLLPDLLYRARADLIEEYDTTPLVFGAVLGTVNVVDAHFCDSPEGNRYAEHACCLPWGEYEYRQHDGMLRSSIVHYVLENPVMLVDPVPWKGRLGLWNLPDEVIPWVL